MRTALISLAALSLIGAAPGPSKATMTALSAPRNSATFLLKVFLLEPLERGTSVGPLPEGDVYRGIRRETQRRA